MNYSGGDVALPKNANESVLLAEMALQYDISCESSLRNGKTIWIGITSSKKVDSWKV
jgi:hypothetical protein